jgi:UDP-GlcNAc:undecaprenyl-phosphate GlcNAc-1-phosphate transferase
MILFYSILSFFWAFFVALFAIPSIIQVAHKKQLLDIPSNRRMHQIDTPRLGGLAIFAGFISALMLFGEINLSIQKLIASTIIIFFIGLKDDMVSVSAFKKFFMQILATSILVFLGDLRIGDFYGLLGIGELPEGISYFFTLIVVIGITNAFNLIDGLDGLAGSLTVIACIIYSILFLMYGNGKYEAEILMSFCLMGAVLAFLRYNIYKAEIFMGDTGSLICGFIISFFAIKFISMETPTNIGVSLPILAMTPIIIPIADTIRVFVIRVFNGVSPFSPDNNHLHHRLSKLGLKPLLIVALYCGYTILNAILCLFLKNINTTILVLLMYATIFLVMFVVELLFNKKIKMETC